MLTIATINPKQAEEYYQQENYYSKGAALENSEWWGRGAETLGLSGAIADNEVYKNLVNGLSPDGKQALRGKPKGFGQEQNQVNSSSKKTKKQSKKQKKQSEERAGVDMTFSAPKSVSLACLVGGDKRLEEAHRQAVKRTLEFTEKHYPQTRIKKQRVQTDNLTVAMWHHDTSRELDPHLHTHCVLMNFTQLDNGKWQSRTDENLYYNKMLLGQIYRQELALECRKLGYEIEPQPKELFEIKGYTREQIEAFSKRHEQIVKYLEGREIDVTTESKVWAWRRTRVKKNHEMGRNEKLPYWHEEADLYGIVHPTPVQGLQTVNTEQPQVTPNKAEIEAELQKVVSVGIEHCSERKVAFTQEEILKFVTAEIKPFGINQLESAITQHPELIKTFDERYTTQSALARELATIELMQQGKGILNPITHIEAIEHYLESRILTQGQREAVTVAATTRDQFIAWQGVAGAGKTYALNKLKQITTALSDVAPDYVIKGFAPSAAAASVLEDELGIEANTVARLLVSKQSEQVQPNQVWIVDEAGLLSAKAAHELLEKATEERARVILVGDTRQLSAIEAGNPFKSLQQAGIQTAHLDESLRQKAPDLQKAVNLAAAGQMIEAIAHLEQVGRIAEIADIKERTTKIAAQYIKLLPQERQKTLILAGTHKEQKAIVNEIRAELKREGTLGYGVEATTLKALNLTSVQARYTHNYSVGDVVVPIREYRRSGLHKSQPYIVKAKSQDKLTLSDEAGNHLTVDPMKFRKTVYKQETNEIATGDCLRWTRNDKELGRRNGQEFTVTGIEEQTATIQYCDGKTDSINLSQPLHCDYALVSTTYSSQGKTADRVLVSSTKDRTVSQESLYVAVSRAKHDLQIFAEDRSFLFEQAEESNAQETVLELLQHQSKQQTPQQPAPDVNQAVESSSLATPLKPKAKRDFPSPIPSVEIRLSKPVASPVKRSDQNPHDVKVPNLSVRLPHPQRPIQKPVEPFWIPNSASDAPPHIEEKHWRELVKGSVIHPTIAARNFRSLGEDPIEKHHEAWEYLMYSDKLERTNTGRLAGGMLNKYAHIEEGGWWCSAGVDSRSFTDLQSGQKPSEQIWGCYKPDAPRENIDKPGKKIKYEHPPKTDLGIFLLDVPEEIAERIYEKAGVNPSDSDRERGFWYCVWKHNLPITITEGAKKAASLLSQGHAAIGLPGIYAGYRSKDAFGNPIKAHLHEELAVFATPGREIRFCFDFETRPETKRNIEIAISRTGSLLKQKQSKVSVVSLPGPDKGVDDLIAAHGPLAYEQQHETALQLQQWRARNKQQQAVIEPPKVLSVDERKLRIKAKLDPEQPANQQNSIQTQEQINDNSSQQLETERATDGRESDSQNSSAIDQKDGADGNYKYRTEQHNRAVEGQQRSTGRKDYPSGSQTDREPERTEIQLHRLLEAISGYLEFQEVEQQLGTNIGEINRSHTGEYLRGKRKQGIARPVERQSSASIDSAASDGSIEWQGGDTEQRATRQLLSAITSYLDAAALAESPVAANLQALIENLSQSQYKDGYEVIRKPLTVSSNHPRQPEISQEALAAITNYVEIAAPEAALAQPLENLLQGLNQRQAPSTNQGQKNNPYLKAMPAAVREATITDYVEQEAVEEILPALENLVAELSILRSSESIAPVTASPNSDISKLALNSINNHIEQAAIELEIIEDLEGLAKELTQPQPKVFNLTKQLDTVISHLLQQLKAVEARKQQETIASSVEAIVNHLEQSEVESALNPQVLQNLSKQLSGLSNRKLNLAMRQLEVFVAGYQTHLQAQAAKPTIEAIADYCEQTAIDEAIALSVERLAQNLSLPSKSKLPKQLQQFSSTIEQYRQQIEARLKQTIQKQIDEPNFEQEPLANQKAQALEQQRLVYRQKYQELQKRVRSYPGFSDSPNWEVDIGVALMVSKESSDPNEVGRVLTQSDQLKEWKALLPEDEYMDKGKAYIHQVYNQAQHLREVRSLQQQQPQKRDFDLDL